MLFPFESLNRVESLDKLLSLLEVLFSAVEVFDEVLIPSEIIKYIGLQFVELVFGGIELISDLMNVLSGAVKFLAQESGIMQRMGVLALELEEFILYSEQVIVRV